MYRLSHTCKEHIRQITGPTALESGRYLPSHLPEQSLGVAEKVRVVVRCRPANEQECPGALSIETEDNKLTLWRE